jgi:hypothetical protein
MLIEHAITAVLLKTQCSNNSNIASGAQLLLWYARIADEDAI